MLPAGTRPGARGRSRTEAKVISTASAVISPNTAPATV